MKIAHWIDGIYAGGAQRMVGFLVQAFPGSLIIARETEDRFLGEQLDGVPICRILTDNVGEVLTYLAVEKPDIFHVHWWDRVFPWHDLIHGNWEPSITSATGKRIKVVVTSHTAYSTFRGHADAVVVLGDWIRENRTKTDGRIQVIYNGVELDDFSPKEDYSLPHEPTCGYIGRIQSDKTLLNFVEILRRAKTDCVFRFIGDGNCIVRWTQDAYPSIRGAEFVHDDDDRFMFHGAVLPDTIPGFLANLDLFVYASKGEAHCVTMLEAMAAGLPIVTAPCITMHETITHLHDGIICPVDEMPGWIDKLLADQALRERLGRNARKTCEERFSRKRVIREYKQLYESLLEED